MMITICHIIITIIWVMIEVVDNDTIYVYGDDTLEYQYKRINALLNKKDCQMKLWGIHYE